MRALVHNLREYNRTVQNEVKTLPSVPFRDKQFIVSSQNCCEAFCLWRIHFNNRQMPLMLHMKTCLPMDHVSNCSAFSNGNWEPVPMENQIHQNAAKLINSWHRCCHVFPVVEYYSTIMPTSCRYAAGKFATRRSRNDGNTINKLKQFSSQHTVKFQECHVFDNLH